eukprot:m.260661 g.260661  ORF g.260661 m.260661 type:complete len:1184 (+) comp23823_c0_seq1:61-3612(+)
MPINSIITAPPMAGGTLGLILAIALIAAVVGARAPKKFAWQHAKASHMHYSHAETAIGSAVVPNNLMVDFLHTPLALAHTNPRFMWSSVPFPDPTARGALQLSFNITVATDSSFAPTSVVCAASYPLSNNSVLCPSPVYATPNTLVFWKICTGGNDRPTTAMRCATSWFGTGLHPTQFTSTWISAPASPRFPISRPIRTRAVVSAADVFAKVLGGQYNVTATRATVFVGSPAYYQLTANGAPVSTHLMGTETEFRVRVMYDSWDVTSLFYSPGPVAFGARLGPAFWGHSKNVLGAKTLPLIFELHVDADIALDGGATQRGRIIFASTDHAGPVVDKQPDGSLHITAPLTWKVAPDIITWADWYQGEHVDGRLVKQFASWDMPSYQPTEPLWIDSIVETPTALQATNLTGQDQQYIAVVATLTPTLTNPLPGVWVFHFNQNYAGYVSLRVPSPASAAGTNVTLYAGELLFDNGTVWNQLIASSNMSVKWTLGGGGQDEIVKPTFCFWGFQYVQVTGWPQDSPPPQAIDMTGYAISSAQTQTGFLTFNGTKPSADIAAKYRDAISKGEVSPQVRGPTSEVERILLEDKLRQPSSANLDMLAGVQHAVLWGDRSNWVSIPTDCPNREKHGWLGDGSVSSAQYARNFFLAAPLRNWLRTMRDNQQVNADAFSPFFDGIVNVYVPNDRAPSAITDAAWASAMGETLEQAWKIYGDVDTVQEAAPAEFRVIEYLQRNMDPKLHLMINQSLYGDWCAAFNRTIYQPVTKDMCATASHLGLMEMGIDFALLTGRGDLVNLYQGRLSSAMQPFVNYYALDVSKGTWLDGLEQTPAVLPLTIHFDPSFDINGPTSPTALWLINDVETTRNMHLSTGAIGTRYLFPVLSDLGRTDLALALAAQDTYPSPGYWVTLGATTCWEDYSGVADGQHPPPPTHNHPFLCSHAYWYYDYLLGVVGGVGFDDVTVRPPILTDIGSMSGVMQTRRGNISVDWSWTGAPGTSNAILDVSIPVSGHAAIFVPVPGLGSSAAVYESGTVVWNNGTFYQSDVVLSAGMSDANMYVVFNTLPGPMSFAVHGKAHLDRTCGALWDGETVNLTCPADQSIQYVSRAGFVYDSLTASAADSFVRFGTGMPGGPISRRFLSTHLVENVCRGRQHCALHRSTLIAAARAVAFGPSESHNGASFCIAWSCASN